MSEPLRDVAVTNPVEASIVREFTAGWSASGFVLLHTKATDILAFDPDTAEQIGRALLEKAAMLKRLPA